ncbi:pyridoxamine 5'-phosphate oxidase family protein [Microbacterium sp. QXD-8]|uniref:Pyridoxamine 5'-phosphate oxidase family protein n=1 Tax=Microbacterium psychrotolerans TaxID=3068321 RepID=A0ABU0YXL1_9MICO|nr:pyridoxamine 5'-phosphate oxidase family protein [Microbacterium sp. QXD-8]MDQ7877062.1 pyridoxamine 5'-phosphate oxidase family protein [Microbacterium sp. QXD-8]
MTFDPSDTAAFAAFVRAQGRAVVATVAPSGAPEAALVGIAALDDGTLIFDASDDSRKVHNLRENGRVAVVIGTEGDMTVQVEGVATITSGASREQHGAAYNEQFPGSRALDQGFAVVVVRPEWVRVYDASAQPAVVTEARW